MTIYTIIPATDFYPETIQRNNDDGSITSIPMVVKNSDYQAYLASQTDQ